MLNEERVKHMTKLAFYESKGGSEDLKVSFCYKKKYITLTDPIERCKQLIEDMIPKNPTYSPGTNLEFIVQVKSPL